ncbi:hypothetical protein OV203_38865 [Nannocystis sp. ILAH1]|uniref:hypothetical protein n=1 Tax=unclassified Nannocystis TaxID=2627009 RepID=UPI002271A4CF|nr:MULTISPECIES: hypothetical protein [unclassified Nannocystis]MCY0993166.1 hypothetical protein [Nannocystis sp. ILAH1]MCY1063401.1 hypothetical protein [Nannocystis sp. RBIL2]
MKSRNRTNLRLLLVTSALVSSACDTESNELMPIVEDAMTPSTEAVGAILASVDAPDGSRLTFIDLGDDDVAVLEGRDVTRPSAMRRFLSEEGTTPFQLYSLAGGKEPAALARLELHHQRLLTQMGPQALKAANKPSLVYDLEDDGYHDIGDDCTNGTWQAIWANTLDPLSTVSDSDYYTQQEFPESQYWYPGTCNNTKTWFGACVDNSWSGSDDWMDDRDLTIQKLVSGVWTNVSGATNILLQADVTGGTDFNAYTFFVSTPLGAKYRAHLDQAHQTGCPGNCGYPSWGIAVAYNPILGCTIEG